MASPSLPPNWSDDEMDDTLEGVALKRKVVTPRKKGKVTFLYVVLLSLAMSLGNVLMRWSFLGYKSPRYDTKAVVCLQELIKLSISYLCVARQRKDVPEHANKTILQAYAHVWCGIPFRHILRYGIPAMFYAIMNNLTYIFLQYETPAELQVLWNFKIVATTFLLSCWLRRKFATTQWAAVLVLTMGVVFAEVSHYSANAPAATPKVKGEHPFVNSVMFGPALTLVGATVMSFANVYCESLYKEDEETETLWIKNVRLYTFGAAFNIAGFVANERLQTSHHGNPFYGFNVFTCIVVFSGSCTGLIIGFLLKFVDNIAVIHADALATIFATILSVAFFKLVVDWWFAVGIVCIIAAIYLYHWEGDLLQACFSGGGAAAAAGRGKGVYKQVGHDAADPVVAGGGGVDVEEDDSTEETTLLPPEPI
jgi:UDP-galactose transporter